MNSRERIAYLRGLLDCMARDEKDTKIHTAIVEALDSLASELEEQAKHFKLLTESQENLEDEVDEMSETLFELEESLGLEPECEEEDDEDDDEPAESYVSVTCPSCAYSFYYRCEEGKEEETLVCPSCGEEIRRAE